MLRGGDMKEGGGREGGERNVLTLSVSWSGLYVREDTTPPCCGCDEGRATVALFPPPALQRMSVRADARAAFRSSGLGSSLYNRE